MRRREEWDCWFYMYMSFLVDFIIKDTEVLQKTGIIRNVTSELVEW